MAITTELAFGANSVFERIVSFSGSDLRFDALSWNSAEDRDGRLFFAGNALIEYDGFRWTTTPILGAYGIRQISFDHLGRIWAAAYGDLGFFERIIDGSWRFQSLRTKLPFPADELGQVWRAHVREEGIYFLTTDRLLLWNGREFHSRQMPSANRLGSFESGGRLFLTHQNTGLLEVKPGGLEVVIPHSKLSDLTVRWLDIRESDWLLATSGGLMRFDGRAVFPIEPETVPLLRDSVIVGSGVRLIDGRYAFATQKSGIVFTRSDGTVEKTIDDSNGLPTRAINSIRLHRSGAIWATSSTHLLSVTPDGSTKVYNRFSGIPEASYRSIARSGENLYIGGAQGLLVSAKDSDTFLQIKSIGDIVHDVRSTTHGIIAGSYYSAYRVDGPKIEKFRQNRHDVIAIYESRTLPGTILLSENRRVYATNTRNDSRLVVTSLPDEVRSFAEDDMGRLWMSTISRGVFVARHNLSAVVDPSVPPPDCGLPALQGRSYVRSHRDGSVFVFAENGGWLKPAGQTKFIPVEYFPTRGVAAVSDTSPDGDLWIVHPSSDTQGACAALVRRDSKGAAWYPHEITALPDIGEPRSIFSELGPTGPTTLWIGGTRSLLRHIVDGDPVAPPPKVPLVRARVLDAADRRTILTGGAIPYSTKAVLLEFGAPDIARGVRPKIESRIEQLDAEWISAGVAGTRELSALRDGNYTIHVRAVAETGVASPVHTLAFRVLPPWWRTGTAATAGALGLLALAAGLFQLRLRTLRRRNAELEAKVRERTAELEAANAAKTEFVANMSHDIRNPLNGIVGLALALEDSRLDDRQREWARTLRECGLYLSSLVDDVLDFAAIEAGRVEIRPRGFSPGDLLRSVQNALQAQASALGATLEIDNSPELSLRFTADAARVQQILVNFASNALKYAGGTVRLSCVTPADSPDELLFSVRDSGPGLDAADQARLFTKFTRLQTTTHAGAGVPGTGLGLAACRHLADLLGGSVGVDSARGRGARFFLRLPRQPETASPAPPTDRAIGPVAETTVLVVEDTDYNAWAALAVLARLGLACDRAATGADALARFGAKRYNLVLLDRNLPDLDGTEVARRMRELERGHAPALILAVTAYCTPADRALCIAAGMDAFVGKPLTPDKLRTVLADLGRAARSAAALELAARPADAPPDLALLTYLSDGSPDGLDRQIDRYLAEFGETETDLNLAAASRDLARVARLAHQLNGQAQLIGATPIAAIAADLEAAARTSDATALGDALSRLARATPDFKTAIAARRPPPRAGQIRAPAHSG